MSDAPTPQAAKPVPVDELAEKAHELIIKKSTSKLTRKEEIDFCYALCRTLGLNPLTGPFDFITVPSSGLRVPYANRNAAEQLRRLYQVSIEILSEKLEDNAFVVHAKATMPDGRHDADIGSVPVSERMSPEVRSNKRMHAVTKAKRRVTLSICGLGFMDETEVESVFAAAGKASPVTATVDPPEEPPFNGPAQTEISRLSQTHANDKPVRTYADRRTPPEDWEKRFGPSEPGEEG